MRKNKGFTLIELLAVIVILGLLMAIAIPSVTKYITESRKKTLTTTLGNYIGALVNDVNDLSYTFTGTNTIYAVPIECIALERGGTDPFGHWYQANDAYFAYVLIQYDDINSKYVYGFTFKDSAGYGLYPTVQANINERGSQVKTGYTINKPKTGELTSLVTLAKWQESGFKVESNTNFQVLEATSEGEIGNGINTCTLQQKGDNYAQVEEEKEEKNKSKPGIVVIGSGTEIGDLISFGDERFYVISNNSETITMLAEFSININTNRQDATASGTAFAYEAYWVENYNLKTKYGSSYPAYVYDSNSNLYQYNENYESYLKSLGVISADVKVISFEQLVELGCQAGGSCSSAPEWVIPGYYYWTGSAFNHYNLWVLTGYDYLTDDIDSQYSDSWRLRPVLTVSKSEIKFN